MTHISNFGSKKAFKEACAADPSQVYLSDPSLFNPMSGSVKTLLDAAPGVILYVTNHPKRSWFANVRLHQGKVKVS